MNKSQMDTSNEITSSPTGQESTAAQPTEDQAAETIQRNYRGYRIRRQLNGQGLSASDRWIEAVKEAQYRNETRPRPRREMSALSQDSETTFAHNQWKHLKAIAQRAQNDDTSDTEGEEDMNPQQLEEYRKKKAEAKKQREQNSKLMGLGYFLEMVDQKHRYGSHLRAYHEIWKKADTNENFFYWLDQGEGRDVEAPTCSRERLDRDQVRYLSREERMRYLVKIDKDGRLRWDKNDERVNTSKDYKDSLNGIVPRDDPTPAYREDTRYPDHGPDKDKGHASGSEEEDSDDEDDADTASTSSASIEGRHYVNEDLTAAKGLQKVHYVSAAALLNHLLQSTTKSNTWIFVADTSFRLYIGIKQSGAFQHSSFLHGARISAAGLIKVKRGQLRRLSPLSGHYRPPTANFRAFVHALRAEGVDMSRVSISRSYAVLLGLEGYMKGKRRAESGMRRVEEKAERVFRPEEARRREATRLDKSQSAQREREVVAEEERLKRERSWSGKLLQRLKSDG